MLDFYYDVIKRKYPEDKSTLLFTDPDSLMMSMNKYLVLEKGFEINKL